MEAGQGAFHFYSTLLHCTIPFQLLWMKQFNNDGLEGKNYKMADKESKCNSDGFFVWSYVKYIMHGEKIRNLNHLSEQIRTLLQALLKISSAMFGQIWILHSLAEALTRGI